MHRALVVVGVVALAAACGPAGSSAPLAPLPHTAYAHYLDGKLSGYRDEWGNATESLSAAAAAAPDQPMVAVELARAQLKARRAEAARATLAAARKRWPRHAQVWLASADLLAHDAPAEAKQAYQKAIELEPSDERGYLGLARLEEPKAALKTLLRLVIRVPDSVDGHYRLAQRLATTRDFVHASHELRAVIERDPDHIDGRLDLARVLRIQGKLGEAIAQTRSAFDRSGQAIDVAEELFWVLCEADDQVSALDLLTLLDDDRSDLEALAVIARLHRGLGRLDESRAIAARITRLEADAGAVVLAETELAAGDLAAAARRALAVPATSERFVDARRVAATALLAADEPQRALDAVAPARAATPDHAELAVGAAYALVDLGKPGDARALVAALGDTPAAVFAQVRVADHAGDGAGALALVEPLVRAKPDLVAALNLAGYLLADRNERLDDAERYLRRARELSPGDPAVLDSWGWLLFRRGQVRAAVRVLDRAVRFAPREAEILVHLAAAWAADGAPRTAAATLDRAAALHPGRAIQHRIDHVRSSLPRTR